MFQHNKLTSGFITMLLLPQPKINIWKKIVEIVKLAFMSWIWARYRREMIEHVDVIPKMFWITSSQSKARVDFSSFHVVAKQKMLTRWRSPNRGLISETVYYITCQPIILNCIVCEIYESVFFQNARSCNDWLVKEASREWQFSVLMPDLVLCYDQWFLEAVIIKKVDNCGWGTTGFFISLMWRQIVFILRAL